MGESVLSFADCVRTLGKKITPTSEDPAVKKACSDQADRMVLAAFINGPGGNLGKHARYNLPTSLQDAIRGLSPQKRRLLFGGKGERK
jgi:hypothetical protein